MFYDFSLYDNVDNEAVNHRIYACSSFGPDFSELPSYPEKNNTASCVKVDFQIGWWEEGFGLAASRLRSIIRQLRDYAEESHEAMDRPFTLFGQTGPATIGIYIGEALLNQGLSQSALKIFEDNLDQLNVSTPSLAMQFCGKNYGQSHTFGIIASSNGKFTSVQDAVKSWANGTCLSFKGSRTFTGQAIFTSPLAIRNGTANSTLLGRSINGYRLRPRVPSPGADGSCFVYETIPTDNCSKLADRFGLKQDDIEQYNKNTWGWNGCNLPHTGVKICLSEGTPPFPTPIENAVCGPLKPGSVPPTDGSKLSDLNPCPLNACCNIWGQCGITKDFCVDTNTGAPGTAAPGTYGCTSNCGMDIAKGTGNGTVKIAYFEGDGMNRDCLLQDASQIDTTQYSHIHFAFGTLTTGYEVEIGNAASKHQFFCLQADKRCEIFFSTHAVFRNGVTSANRLKMATNIADFIKKHELDGVDIDWEYPGAPDLPGIPPASKDDGPNYLALLVTLRNILPGKSISITAPSSYWYLKQFPIKDISKVVDYIVYMTYNLYGQSDPGNTYPQEDCPKGYCLRSQVNLTETKQSLAMITKAGVPGNKVIVGITSYGRSFHMAEAGCWGPSCVYTGGRGSSDATKGRCTATASFLANAEIEEIIKGQKRDGRVVTSFHDSSSNSDILVYDSTQWVNYMSASTKKERSALYSAWGFGGTTDWAINLQTFYETPKNGTDWGAFNATRKDGANWGALKGVIKSEKEADHSRNGNWTTFKCTDRLVKDNSHFSPLEQWNGLNADAAWADVIRIWKETERPRKLDFSQAVSSTFHVGNSPRCGMLAGSNCDHNTVCESGLNSDESGPAAMLIFNSMVALHQLYKAYHDTLFKAASTVSSKLKDMENKFAPIPPKIDERWKLLLIDLLTLGTLSAIAPFFNQAIRKLPFFSASEASFANAKDTTLTLIGQQAAIAKDMMPKSGDRPSWTAEHQDAFSAYIGSVIDGWGDVTDGALKSLFDGSDASIDILWKAISGGRFITGCNTEDCSRTTERMSESELRDNIEKSIFGFTIPGLWTVSNKYPFVIDASYGCDAIDPLKGYLTEETQKATGACVDGKLYYIASVVGEARVCKCEKLNDNGPCQKSCRPQKFQALEGLQYLDGNAFGGITKQDLITGAVKTYLSNGKKNGAPVADPTNQGTMDNLLKIDSSTSLAVLDKLGKDSANFPCGIVAMGRDRCGNSDFVDKRSDKSPIVEDCMQIISNIQGDTSTDWTHQVLGKKWREIAKAGSCAFSVRASKINGNINFEIGGQDVIDIITTSIEKFGQGGKVAAGGHLDCGGNTKKQEVEWEIYS
ncbi:chitinase [Phaeosphaeriaceae sp. PMI808]|nr:chitinase [Phaeosphaeriaceae sp. PMI808]